MLKNILKILLTILGMILGLILGSEITKTSYYISKIQPTNTLANIITISLGVLIIGFIFYMVSPIIVKFIMKLMDYVERSVQNISGGEVFFGTVGAILGLIISFLLLSWVARISSLASMICIIVSIIIAVLGAKIAIKKKEEVSSYFLGLSKYSSNKEKKNKNKGHAKVLDTSVIIDGRIFDLCQTGFIEGTLVIPNFVLEELRHIADSSDVLKRNRGRRGLDILNKIQKELNIEVEIYEKDFPDIAEVDSKLLKLAQVLGGKVITNDYNLNKVAEFQGVPVLNINELANAIKPVVIPGEEMVIDIIKEGKEYGQGVAYLDDGTMIVVEGGRKCIGEKAGVVVTSVLQTAAGRMIFAKPKEDM